MNLVPGTANFLQRIALGLFADFQFEGRENVPLFGPLIVVANHMSNVDPSLLNVSIPRRLVFLAKHELFRGRLLPWFLRHYGAFPLNRSGASTRAFRWTLRQLELDQALIVFPEGTRSRDGMKKALPGVASLALKSQAPILPVGITGSEGMVSPLRVWYPTGRVRVNIGKVFSLPSISGRPNREVLGSLTDMIMERVAALLPPDYRGVYGISARTASETADTAT